MTTEYKGFKIKEIYQSSDGRGNMDYFISSENGLLGGEVKMKTTISKIKAYIDSKSVYENGKSGYEMMCEIWK